MREGRECSWLPFGLAVLVLVSAWGGCNNGRTPSTTVEGRAPVYVNGVPQVTATPSRGVAGTRVRLEGYGFADTRWRRGADDLWLTDTRGESDCLVVAPAEHDVTVTADGHLSGTFVVPARGACRFGAGEVDTGPLEYEISYQCTDCHIGTFTVILPGESTEEPTGARCRDNVVYGVQNLADEIYAEGLSCPEAVLFVRDQAGSWQPPDGPAHVEADGFSCDRTGRSDGLPPRANYRCNRGAQTIWLVRT